MMPFRQANTKGIISTQIRQKINVSVVCLDEFLFFYICMYGNCIYKKINIEEIKCFLFLNLVFSIKDLL